MTTSWKKEIIALTEHPAAKAGKIDASFFPPVTENSIQSWEKENARDIPGEIRSYLCQSDGLEAQRGEIWPVLPLEQWTLIDDACAWAEPVIRFGETEEYFYHVSLGHSPSIYRAEKFGSKLQFSAATFRKFLELIFRGDG
ncbi:MAG: SMI1/KNR4 family protein [Verrucomicrobiales bacterium]|nr:SMI1/KNR4 family protein [Verrucomicrobiales bacterium]